MFKGHQSLGKDCFACPTPFVGSVLLKTLHVWVGYVFALNIGLRIVWALVGSHYARWRQMLTGGRGQVARVRRYAAAFTAGRPELYLGHNPLGRIAAAVLLLLIAAQAPPGWSSQGPTSTFRRSDTGSRDGSPRRWRRCTCVASSFSQE